MGRPKKSGKSVADLVPMPKNERLKAMTAVTKQMTKWRPAADVLHRVQSVATIFPQFDKGSRVLGLPIRRYTLVHGESASGKTLFCIGCEVSFLQQGHFVGHMDAEVTTPHTWLKKLMGSFGDHPCYMALRPRTYEEADDALRQFCNMVGNARSKGHVPHDTSGLIVLDSLQKLVPAKLFAKLLKEGSARAGIDGMNGMAGAVQAGLNKQWLNEIIPLMEETNCAFVAISRESEDRNATTQQRMYGDDFKIQGGKAVVYDSSLSIRVIHSKNIYHGSEDDKNMIGERHLMRIWRSKVAGRDQKNTDCYFHTSNGNFIPEGFDRARDVLELARKDEIVTGESHLSWGDVKLGHGENQAVKRLTDNPDLLSELETKIRSGFVADWAEPEEEVEAPPPRRKKKSALQEQGD